MFEIYISYVLPSVVFPSYKSNEMYFIHIYIDMEFDAEYISSNDIETPSWGGEGGKCVEFKIWDHFKWMKYEQNFHLSRKCWNFFFCFCSHFKQKLLSITTSREKKSEFHWRNAKDLCMIGGFPIFSKRNRYLFTMNETEREK